MTFSFKKLAVAVAAVAAVSLAGAGQARAGIFLRLTDGVTTQTFFSAANTATFNTSIDNYGAVTVGADTNAPGGAVGLLTTTLVATANATGVTRDLTLEAEVVNSNNINDLTRFTSPTAPTLFLTSTVTNTGGGNNPNDRSQFTSVALGAFPGSVAIASTVAAIPGTSSNGPIPFGDGTGYYLVNQIVLDAVTAGSPTISVVGQSLVSAVVPEPGTMAAALTGLLFVGGLGLRRRSK